MFAADVQHRAQRDPTQSNIVAHVEKQAVQVLPQLHRLHSKHVKDEHTSSWERRKLTLKTMLECRLRWE